MKKLFPIILALAVFALLFQFIVNFFIKEHSVQYSIKTKDNAYFVKEKFKLSEDGSIYDFTILDKDDSFYTFSLNYDFNKQDKIIKNIKYYTTKDLKCIFPVYKREASSDVQCLYKGEQVSYDYLKQIDNYDISLIIKKLKKDGFDSLVWQDKSEAITESENKRIKVYKKNIMKDYIFTMWNYKGIYILKDNKIINKELLDKDQYEAVNSLIVDKYYVVADQSSGSKIMDLSYYNIKDMGKGVISFDEPISSDSYFNGVYDNKLYITDLDNKKQYMVDVANEKILEVGNRNDGFKGLVGGKLTTVSAKDFLSEKVYFTNRVLNKKITKKYGDVDIRKEGHFYYFKTKTGEVYRSNEENISKPVLLFSFPGISDWKVVGEDILVVAKDTLYFYNPEVGLSPIAINSELNYNFKNICDFWKK